MIAVFWFLVIGYLMVGIGELLPVRFRSNRDDALSHLHICAVALGYALSWPVRYARSPHEE